ncbi:PAS domain S-box protein [Geomonas sp. RF6]|uniref:PAS domain S-box protein n=1 Tax=Geomonas sp. RF6 TaxID=2897342 RepID=UPI001E5D0928|nr:PAS domain S-box protein [Geomonas sp. RF6]UFS69785.1 PAS domain S-box protein [Geomonas sp. RF6]
MIRKKAPASAGILKENRQSCRQAHSDADADGVVCLQEELRLLNEELQDKVQALDRLTSDMENVLSSSQIATVFLDRSLRIKRYTPAFGSIFNLTPASIGEELPLFTGDLAWGALAHDAEIVLQTSTPRERDVTLPDGRHFLMRFFPYLGNEGEVEGVVITVIDLTDRKRTEDALREVEARQRLFIDHAPAALAMFDRKMRYLYASNRWLSDYGLQGRDVRGICHYDLFPELPERWKEAHARGFAGEVLRSEGEPFERADGAVQWVRWELRPWEDASGAVGGIVIFAEDITDLKEAEEALRATSRKAEENLAQMQAILDNLTEGVVISDLQGKPFHWNPAAVAMHEFRDEEEYVRTMPEFKKIFEFLDGDQVVPNEKWPLCRILDGEVLRGLELRLRRLDRKWERTFSYRGRLARDGEGRPLLAVISIIDITERRKDEEAQARLAAIVESSEDAIIAKDLHGVIRTWNAGAERMFGYRPEEIIGRPVSTLIPTELQSEEQNILRIVTAGDRVPPFETVRVTKDGTHFFASVTISALRDGGGRIIGASKIVRNITEKKEAEEALQRSNVRLNLLAESAGELLAGVSLPEALTSIGHRVMDFLDCHLFFSYFADRKSERLYLSAYGGITEEEAQRVAYLPYGSSICNCAEEGVCSVVADDASGVGDPRHELARSHGIEAFACHPLTVRGRVLGTLSFGTRTRSRFRDEELAVMKAVAGQVAIAVERHRTEQALRDSEERLRLAYQAARIGTFDYDVQSGLTRWSPEMEAMYGVEHTGEPRTLTEWEARLHPEGREDAKCLLQQAFSTTEPVEGEWHVLWPDGSVHWLFARFQVFRDPSGKPVRLIGVNYDITERKEVEEELRRAKSEAEEGKQILDALMEYIPLGITIADAPGMQVQRVSRYGRELIGLERGMLVEEYVRRLQALLPDGATPLPLEQLPMRRAVLGGETVRDFELVQVTPRGESMPLLADAAPIRDSSGAITGGIVAWREIRERKRLEETLRRAHDELEQRVQERTEELAAAVTTLQGEIRERLAAEENLRRLNRLYEVLSEIDQAIIRASGWHSLFEDFCRIAVQHGGFPLAWVGLVDDEHRTVRRVAACGATEYLDEIHVGVGSEATGDGPMAIAIRNGTYYVSNDFENDPRTAPWQEAAKAHGIRASASIALKEEERVVGALTLYSSEFNFFDVQQVTLLRQMGRDLSFALGNLLREARRREAEEALRDETLERLRAVEELREKERLLVQQSRQAALGEMLGNIAHQWRQPLNSLGLMIQELSLAHESGEFSKEYLDSSIDSIMQIVYHMSQTIDDFRTFFSPDKEKNYFNVAQALEKVLGIIEGSFKKYGINVEVSATADPVIFGFPNEYSQVLLNILLNARDAFMERQIADPKVTIGIYQERGKSVLSIRDNAGGIPETILHKIFDPYFTTKGPDKGTGVGLYMSKTIIEKNMHGTLTARNTGEGAEFFIEV